MVREDSLRRYNKELDDEREEANRAITVSLSFLQSALNYRRNEVLIERAGPAN
jgi:hypothetical protein